MPEDVELYDQGTWACICLLLIRLSRAKRHVASLVPLRPVSYMEWSPSPATVVKIT